MTPEERKAIAFTLGPGGPFRPDPTCERLYPGCCVYHEGFDDALSLATDVVYEGRRFYAIEPPEKGES